ncbi:TPA: hypothetical protein U1212_000269 [Streptococcus suis]|nr:hypothetical protein [Streptococcus suis]
MLSCKKERKHHAPRIFEQGQESCLEGQARSNLRPNPAGIPKSNHRNQVEPAHVYHGRNFYHWILCCQAHISIAPETVTMETFAKDIKEAGYEATSNLFKIKEGQEVNWDLLRNIIAFNMEEKKGYEKFWR